MQRAAMPIAVASSGSLNVRGRTPSGYIEKVVIDCSKITAFAKRGGTASAGKGKGKGAHGRTSTSHAGSTPGTSSRGGAAGSRGVPSTDQSVPDDPEDVAPLTVYAHDHPHQLLTVYHHAFANGSIVGWTGYGSSTLAGGELPHL